MKGAMPGNRLPGAAPTGDRKTHRFVLVGDRAPNLTRLRALRPEAAVMLEAGGPHVRLRCDLAAPTLTQAVIAGIRAAESAGMRVLRVDTDDWVTAAAMAGRIGRSRETVRLWAGGRLGPGGFPPALNPGRDTTFFSWAEALPWLRQRAGLDLPEEDPTLVAANLAIQLRALLPRVPQKRAVIDLLG